MGEPTVTFSLMGFTGAPLRPWFLTGRFSGAIASEPVVVAWVVVVVVTDVWASAGAAATTPSAARPAMNERVILLPPEISVPRPQNAHPAHAFQKLSFWGT